MTDKGSAIKSGVVIRGSGAAAQCAAHLLKQAGFFAVVEEDQRRTVPALMLNDAAVALVRDVFGKRDLFEKSHRIEKRVVAWGKNADPIELPHGAVVVSETELIAGLRTGVKPRSDFSADWMVVSSQSVLPSLIRQRFGTRESCACRVWLPRGGDAGTCWIESVEDGWLFLIPKNDRCAWLLAAGCDTGELIRESRLIREQIDAFGEDTGRFAAYPSIAAPLGGPGWLACGTAAMAFDPLCGDGTAHAVREAILASAVIRAANAGMDATRLLAHYEARLIAAFDRHLHLCREYYRSGFGGLWWDREIECLDSGIAWCTNRRGEFPGFQFRLDGYELSAIS